MPFPNAPTYGSSFFKKKFPFIFISNIFFRLLLCDDSKISDWLNLEQDMLRTQHVEVGNVDAIADAIDKQKQVVRELDFKKPQLDDLVHMAENIKRDASRQQLQHKGNNCKKHDRQHSANE